MNNQAERVKRNLQNSYSQNEILKAFEPDLISKGKVAQIGEIREWQGKKYQKQANGEWSEVTQGKGKKTKSEEAEPKKSNSLDESDKKDGERLKKVDSQIDGLKSGGKLDEDGEERLASLLKEKESL